MCRDRRGVTARFLRLIAGLGLAGGVGPLLDTTESEARKKRRRKRRNTRKKTRSSLCQTQCGGCSNCLVKLDGSVVCGGGTTSWGCGAVCSSDSDCAGCGFDHCAANTEDPETGEEFAFCMDTLPRCASVDVCVI